LACHEDTNGLVSFPGYAEEDEMILFHLNTIGKLLLKLSFTTSSREQGNEVLIIT